MALYQKQLFGADGFVILTKGKVPGHLTRLDDKGAFPREYASLFTSAPDLLEALVEILGPLNVCSDNQNVSDDVCLPVDMTMGELRKARAAIAKATGAA